MCLPVNTKKSPKQHKNKTAEDIIVAILELEDYLNLCPSLLELDAGFVAYNSDGVVTRATFSCVDGYHLNTNEIIECASGVWQDQAPTCVCEAQSIPEHGNMTLSEDLMVATFTCDLGYILVGSSNSVCQSDGTGWNNVPPSCKLCADIPAIESGSGLLSTDGLQTTVTFQFLLVALIQHNVG
ncbi:CSMD1-like protein [Mya arenaria]|uniref:CSMD1-like protein n=1 Tax=Mya arenaria TaxID=6604 RepID=A0ABY7DLU1_MYAAR|nr:CSMD1-like protein [Mya arenaria]